MNQHDGNALNKGNARGDAGRRSSGSEDGRLEEKYRMEIDRLLDLRPEMVQYQREIERRLSHAGTFENRMAVLGIMMEDKLSQLKHHLDLLADKVTTWDAMASRSETH
jgi:hypothetical protein